MSLHQLLHIGGAFGRQSSKNAMKMAFTGGKQQPFSQFIGGGGNNNDNEPSFTTRTNETVIFKSNAKWPWYVGKGAAVQVYAAVALSAQIVYTMPETASTMEMIASAGPLASASAFLFFGTKYMCERVISNLSVCRTIGQREEFLRIKVGGIFEPKVFDVLAKDVRVVNKDDKGMLTIKIQRTTFWLDTGKAEVLEQKSLDTVLQGKPVVVRWGDKRQQSKKSKKN